MARIRLKKILKRDPKTASIIQQLVDCAGGAVAIVDEKDKCLFGEIEDIKGAPSLIELDGQLIGKVYGAGDLQAILSFIQLLMSREQEQRKLGAEVLDLYREVNLMYNFAQKLAETIEQREIAKLTLGEVNNQITANSGIVTLLDEDKKNPELVADFGPIMIQPETLQNPNSFFRQLMQKEDGEIINDHQILDGSTLSILYVPLNIKNNILGAILLVNTEGYQFTAADLKLLSTLSIQSAAAIESAQLYERNIREVKEREAALRALHEVTSRFVPNEFIKSLGYDHITQVTLGDSVEKEVTVFFSDIRGYTALSESMSPSETFKFVNAFNNRMGPIILKNRGFINQYLGDGIMAIFPFSPADALNASIQIHQELQVYNSERLAKKRSEIKIGIGLHTGPLIMGITGDQQRLDATTISDTVNTAARIESLTKVYGVNIMLTDYSLLKIEGATPLDEVFDLGIRSLGDVQVKGKQQAVKIYECFDGDTSKVLVRKQQSLGYYETALQDFYNQEFEKSVQGFKMVLTRNPEDKTAFFFLKKANQLLAEGVQAGWTGVERMTSK